ncbi:MAG: hypothetical protein ACREVL_03650 [Solimonas sp.]
MSSEAVAEIALFPFIDPAVQVIVACAAGLVLLFFFSALSDALRARSHRRGLAPAADRRYPAHEPTAERDPLPR